MWISRGYIEHLADADAAGLVVGPSLTRTSLNAVIASQVPEASTSIAGRVRLAGVADAVAGTAQNMAVTPAGLAAAALSHVVTGPQLVRQVKGQGTMTAWVARVGPLVTFQGAITGASNQALTTGYPFEGLQSITWALPKQDTILQAGLSMGRWGFKAVGVQSDGLFIAREAVGTSTDSWTLHFFGSWFAADAV